MTERAKLESALSEANINLTRALEALEDVPMEIFAREEDRLRLGELIARAGGVVAAAELELARGETPAQADPCAQLGPCGFPHLYDREEE
jgi:hypothetical protein